jgi:hypothetical protein
MSIPIPLFQPIDIPPDISMILNDQNYYIFCKENEENEKMYFTVEYEIDKNQMVSFLVDASYVKTSTLLFEHVYFYGNNVNEYLWRISSSGYNNRFIKLEIIERIRSYTDISQLNRLNSFLKDNMSSNNYPEEV